MPHVEMEPFRITDLNPENAELILQTAQVAYEASQSISKIWLPTVEAAVEEIYPALFTSREENRQVKPVHE